MLPRYVPHLTHSSTGLPSTNWARNPARRNTVNIVTCRTHTMSAQLALHLWVSSARSSACRHTVGIITCQTHILCTQLAKHQLGKELCMQTHNGHRYVFTLHLTHSACQAAMRKEPCTLTHNGHCYMSKPTHYTHSLPSNNYAMNPACRHIMGIVTCQTHTLHMQLPEHQPCHKPCTQTHNRWCYMSNPHLTHTACQATTMSNPHLTHSACQAPAGKEPRMQTQWTS